MLISPRTGTVDLSHHFHHRDTLICQPVLFHWSVQYRFHRWRCDKLSLVENYPPFTGSMWSGYTLRGYFEVTFFSTYPIWNLRTQ
jgi:hypothetical protein